MFPQKEKKKCVVEKVKTCLNVFMVKEENILKLLFIEQVLVKTTA